MPPRVKIEAIIAPSVWRELGASVALAERVPPSYDPRLGGMHQYACKIEADGRYVICVRFGDIRQHPRANDTVHVRRTRGSVYEDTLRTVHISRGKIELRPLNGKGTDTAAIPYPSTDPEEKVELRGVVVGFFTPTSF